MKQVAILTVSGSYLSAVYGIQDIMDDAEKRHPGTFQISIIDTDRFIAGRTDFDIVILPPFRVNRPEIDALFGDAVGLPTDAAGPLVVAGPLVAALTRFSREGKLLCSVCAGAFYLCATGIADGETVTTHWNLAERLASRFPAVTVQKEKMLIDRGRFITAGGLTGYQDLALHLIQKEAGRDAALETAGTFLINPEDRSQLQYMTLSLSLSPSDALVEAAAAFIRSDFSRPIGLAEIASHCGITVRTLLRHFRLSGNLTPGAYLQSVRIDFARRLLATGRSPVKEAALLSGYRDSVSFSRAFRSLTGLAPGDYARRYRPSGFVSSR